MPLVRMLARMADHVHDPSRRHHIHQMDRMRKTRFHSGTRPLSHDRLTHLLQHLPLWTYRVMPYRFCEWIFRVELRRGREAAKRIRWR